MVLSRIDLSNKKKKKSLTSVGGKMDRKRMEQTKVKEKKDNKNYKKWFTSSHLCWCPTFFC